MTPDQIEMAAELWPLQNTLSHACDGSEGERYPALQRANYLRREIRLAPAPAYERDLAIIERNIALFGVASTL